MMNSLSNVRAFVRDTLVATTAGLIMVISVTSDAIADESPKPQAHSDGVVTAVEDTAITAKVNTRLAKDGALKHSDISVTTTNGVVTLTGTAVTARAKSIAEKDAKAVSGVKSVDNNLGTPSSNKLEAKTKHVAARTEEVASDSWITTKVKSEILADSVSKGFDVNVSTYDGVVKLKGTLANRDAIDHVKDIAEKVQGVKSVDISGLTTADHS